jgi:hypothetical protein
MSERPNDIDPEAVFTDTCILYDYTVDEVPEAATLFDTYKDLGKFTSRFGYTEYTNVAKRRAEACEAWEQAVRSGSSSVGNYTFTTPENLRDRDRERLRELQEKLIEECGEIEALRRINERRRQYNRGSEVLFGHNHSGKLGSPYDDGLVTILPDLNYKLDIHSQLQKDISNASDCQIVAEATEWYANGGSDCFVTSDKGDFADDSTPSDRSNDGHGLPASLEEFGRSRKSLQKRVNEHIDAEYEDIDHLWLYQLIEFVERYE